MVTATIPNIMHNEHNAGNFQALVDFRVDSGDHVLGEQIKIAGRNATYRLKTIKN